MCAFRATGLVLSLDVIALWVVSVGKFWEWSDLGNGLVFYGREVIRRMT